MSLKILVLSRPSLFKVPGGDTVQLKETASALQKIGVQVQIKGSDEEIDYSSYDLMHFFNIIRPNVISFHVKRSNLPFVISTIFVDYTEVERKYRSFGFRFLSYAIGSDGVDYLKTIGRAVLNGERIMDLSYLWHGHRKSVERLLTQAEILLPNSKNEYKRLKKRYDFDNDYIVVSNAVSKDFFDSSEDLNNRQNRSGVVCVARIEVIKNQLNLIKALINSEIQLKLIGKVAPNHKSYFDQCKKLASKNIHFLGQLSKEQVKDELSKAEVHILPSFFETTGLSSLEAAARGCKVIVTRKGDTEEYFEDLAFYCDPDDPNSIRLTIEEALRSQYDPRLKQKIEEEYSWDIAAKKTKEAYVQVLNKG